MELVSIPYSQSETAFLGSKTQEMAGHAQLEVLDLRTKNSLHIFDVSTHGTYVLASCCIVRLKAAHCVLPVSYRFKDSIFS